MRCHIAVELFIAVELYQRDRSLKLKVSRTNTAARVHYTYVHGDHLSRKPGNVGNCSYQENVRELSGENLIKENCLLLTLCLVRHQFRKYQISVQNLAGVGFSGIYVFKSGGAGSRTGPDLEESYSPSQTTQL